MKLKKPIIILGIIGAGLILWGMLLLAETGLSLNKKARCKANLMKLKLEIGNYKHEFGTYPTGDYTEVLKKLFKDDPKQIKFFSVDPWGMPYAINFDSTNGFVILSAGKDKIFGTKDDIIFNSRLNDFEEL